VVSGDDKISDRAFPPVSLDRIKRCAKPHVTVGLKKRVRELKNSISIMFERSFKRDVEQTSGSPKTVVVLAELQDSEGSGRAPIPLKALEDIDAAGNSLTTDMNSSLLPQAEVSSHVNVFRFL
jgi:hypothetical protein